MPKLETGGWYLVGSLKNLCQDCQFAFKDEHMCACEYGEDRFPSSKMCRYYKHEDDEE